MFAILGHEQIDSKTKTLSKKIDFHSEVYF